MRKLSFLLVLLLLTAMQALAQRTITGKVTSADDGNGIPGVTVLVKGTSTGVLTDLDGKYNITVAKDAKALQFSFVGMKMQEIALTTSNVVDVVMQSEAQNIEGVVVTALGITRDKKSLGYSTQELKGDDINAAKRTNFVDNLSGKLAGVQVKTNGNMGGSTNVIIRGSSSITGNNQALFIIDGVPVNNDNTNNSGQISGRNGYDYGNAASDIDPNDIESMNVLKGAAATALYGSRAANGVILITTKKGKKSETGKKNLGVSINSSVTTGFVDKSTFPKYQNQYGAGYGTYFYGDPPMAGFEYLYDVNGDGETDYTVPTYDDASYGQKFDPSIMVYQWDSYYPASPNYKKATPWTAGANGPATFFDNSVSLSNNVEVAGGSDNSTFRLGYTNTNDKGIMPNSEIAKNAVTFNGSYDILKNLTVSAYANYVQTKGKGRNSTGYSDNILSGFRQWMQTNVDYGMEKDLYFKTGENITWNPNNPDDLRPAYWDNPYFQRFQNYETDTRSRIIGYTQADWKLNNYFSLMGRYAVDTYSELQEERKALGSSSGEFGVQRPDVTSGYSRFNKSFSETNLDFLLKFNKNLTEDLNLSALLGTNMRRSRVDQIFMSTNGGLIVPGQYSIGNSQNSILAPEERLTVIGVNGVFAGFSLGFKNFLFLDGTIRRDQSSTLPESNNAYFYPAVSGSFIFSNVIPKNSWLNLGKVRLGYAQVGNSAPWGAIKDTYAQNTSFGGTALFSVPSTKNNVDLKPENTSSIEAGLEMKFFQGLLGFDLSLYKKNTVNQIIPVAVSTSTGYSAKYVNAGEMMNKGIELMLFGTPVKSGDFQWDITLNWAKNINEVVSLEGDLKNLQIASLQGGVTINARVGEPYGTIQGKDYVYDEATGKKQILGNGFYKVTSASDIVIGNVNPDWTGGLNNKFSYKNWSFSFLLDMQRGGSVFSLDQYYGLATGLYAETVYNNDLGNSVRDDVTMIYDENGKATYTYEPTSGGVVLDGVYGPGTILNIGGVATDVSGQQNFTRAPGNDYRLQGYSKNPNSTFVYDASYLKLREAVITYSIPKSVLSKSFFNGVSFSLVGSNLWIISKNLPHADPEASQSSGNVQGWQSGVMPTTRNVGFSVNLQF
jgi:TonB-linked SusC/RagA family outer membrane protein